MGMFRAIYMQIYGFLGSPSLNFESYLSSEKNDDIGSYAKKKFQEFQAKIRQIEYELEPFD